MIGKPYGPDRCPASTGLRSNPRLGECLYHLCVEASGHRSADLTHRCICDYRWTCLSGSLAELHDLYTKGAL